MAQQQGQSFSQLKDAKEEQTEVVFNPMEQVRRLSAASTSKLERRSAVFHRHLSQPFGILQHTLMG